MLSLSLQCALESEVIGQPRAVHTLVRTLTVALSGLSSSEGPIGIYLFVGPSGTGKTHMARTLARRLHGDIRRLAVADCGQLGGRQEATSLGRQLAPFFRFPATGQEDGSLTMGPLSILLVEHLERARPEVVQALLTGLETGRLNLPEGKFGSLRGCLVLMTTNLCAREIYDAGRQEIGFSRASGDLEDSEKARIYQLCSSAAEKVWGSDLLAHLDDLIVFHRLREGHLPAILRRLVAELNQRLAPMGLSCELEPAAATFVAARSARFLRHGAWVLARVFRRFVQFPLADLVLSSRIPPGTRVVVGLDEDRLCFQSVMGGAVAPSKSLHRPREVAIAWEEEDAVSPLSHRHS